MTVADEHLLSIGAADLDAWDRELTSRLLEQVQALPDDARETRLLYHASHPLVTFVISAAAHGLPGADLARDATTAASVALSRRTVHAYRSAGLDGRGAERNLRLLDRINALVGRWPEPRWSDSVRRRVEQLAQARRDGRERGRQLRTDRGERALAPAAEIAWMLRHPNDHWFRRARPSIADPVVGAVIDEWIADFGPSYLSLVRRDWSAEESRAELVIDVEIRGEEPKGLRDSWSTVVLAEAPNGVEAGSELMMRRVPPDQEQFNGYVLAALPRERWRACAAVLSDGSILPGDGTRRLKPA